MPKKNIRKKSKVAKKKAVKKKILKKKAAPKVYKIDRLNADKKEGESTIQSAKAIGKKLADDPYTIEDGVSQSMLSGFFNCRLSCRYGLDGWRSPRLKDSLNYGSLYHDLLENFFRGVMLEGYTLEDAKPFMNLFLETWLEHERSKDITNPRALQSSEVCAAQASATFLGYCEMWPDDFEPGRWIELEGVFEADFHGYLLRGRMDGLQRAGKKRKYYRLMEHKTKARIEEEALDRRLAFDFQNLFYLTALNCQLKTKGIDELARVVYYDIIRRPGQKFNPDKESLSDYSVRVKEDVAKRPDHYFKRSEIFYTAKDLERFQEELLIKLQIFERWLKDEEPTFKNEQACVAKWNCTFLDACASAGNMSNYVQTGELFVELKD